MINQHVEMDILSGNTLNNTNINNERYLLSRST